MGWLLPRHLQVTTGLCLVVVQLLGPGAACHKVSPRRILAPTDPSCAACSWQRDRPHANMGHLSPVLLWQVGLHLEENILSLFDQALDLLDGLLLFRTHVGLASGEEEQALASGSAPSQHERVLALDTVLCLGQGHPKDSNSKLEASSICGAGRGAAGGKGVGGKAQGGRAARPITRKHRQDFESTIWKAKLRKMCQGTPRPQQPFANICAALSRVRQPCPGSSSLPAPQLTS